MTIFVYSNHKCCKNRFHNKMKEGFFFFFKTLILYTKKEIIMHFSVIENLGIVLFFFFNSWEKDNFNPEYLN